MHSDYHLIHAFPAAIQNNCKFPGEAVRGARFPLHGGAFKVLLHQQRGDQHCHDYCHDGYRDYHDNGYRHVCSNHENHQPIE